MADQQMRDLLAKLGFAIPAAIEQSRFKTLPLPVQGPNAQPIVLATATGIPARVLVSNVSGTDVLLGFASGDVVTAGGPTPDTFILRPSDDKVFVLAPRQQLLGVGVGVGAQVSIATSAALVLERMV